jgi:hypothetical protein
MNEILLIVALLFTKHLIVDFFLQTKFQWSNKGTYGHLGGVLHASLHAIGTLLVFVFFVSPPMAVLVACLDGVIHYHVDWLKMNLNAKMGWGANTHEQFWWLLGLDQYLHAITYIGLIALAV